MSVNFQGGDNYAIYNGSTDYSGARDFIMSIWYKPVAASVGSLQRQFAKVRPGSDTHAAHLSHHVGDHRFSNRGTVNRTTTQPMNQTLNEWLHIAAYFKVSDNTNSLFINGNRSDVVGTSDNTGRTRVGVGVMPLDVPSTNTDPLHLADAAIFNRTFDDDTALNAFIGRLAAGAFPPDEDVPGTNDLVFYAPLHGPGSLATWDDTVESLSPVITGAPIILADDHPPVNYPSEPVSPIEIRIERSLDGTTGWAEIHSGPDTSPYLDTGLDPATQYFYRLRRYDTETQLFSGYSTVESALTDAIEPV